MYFFVLKQIFRFDKAFYSAERNHSKKNFLQKVVHSKQKEPTAKYELHLQNVSS